MQFLIENWKAILDSISHVVFGVTVIATAIVRLTPTKSDDEKMAKVLAKIHKVFCFLPTFGINPKTKELEELMQSEKHKP